MADKEIASIVSKIKNAIQTTYTIVEKQERTSADIGEIRADIRALRNHYADLDRRVGKMEEQRNTTDAKISASKAEMNAELQKAKAEMNADLQKAKAELTAEFHKARYETMMKLEREYNKRAAELYRQALDLNRAPSALKPPAIEAKTPDEPEND